MSVYIDKTRPYPYCPGCTHGAVIDAIGRALEKIGADPKRSVLVSDIGCVGMADKYFTTHTFHGLHGRSFTYACGIKMARPDLNVFVLVGDGGCGIGGNHLINAARRNVGITVICFNNFNFGMTGGEHSVTTPLEGKTYTTPMGSIEPPFDLCSLVAAAGGTFVARKTAFEKDLDDVIAQAMNHEGFSFLDVWELCSAYYSPMNAFKKKELEGYMERRGLKTGILCKKEGAEYSRQLVGLTGDSGPVKPEGIKSDFSSNYKGASYDILIAGSAGMKIVSAAAALAKAGILSGLWASEKDDYPVTVQAGHSMSVVRFSKERIGYLGTTRPNAVIVVSEDGYKKVKDILGNLLEKDIVVIDSELPEIDTKAKVYRVGLGDKSFGLNKTNKTIAAVAYLLSKTDVVKPDAFKASIEMISNEKIREGCLKAYNEGVIWHI